MSTGTFPAFERISGHIFLHFRRISIHIFTFSKNFYIHIFLHFHRITTDLSLYASKEFLHIYIYTFSQNFYKHIFICSVHRISTDILFAKKCGLRSLLVLSGISTINDIYQAGQNPPKHEDLQDQPDCYAQNLAEFGKYL